MTHPDLRAAADQLISGDEELAAERDEETLAGRLYSWYLNTTPLPRQDGRLLPYEVSLPAALRAAHADSTRFEGGWKAETVSTWGRVVATKGPLTRYLERGEYTVPRRPGLAPRPNDPLLVARCWAWIDEETGFWHTRHGIWPPTGADRLVRVYWNAIPREGPALIGHLSRVLVHANAVSSMLKTPAQREHGGRADAFVLYLGASDFAALLTDLRGVAQELSSRLRPATPRFARPLAPGVAFAEGKLEGDSFGESRCRLVARAFTTAPDDIRAEAPRLTDRITEQFRAAGLDPERPHLEPGSVEDYGT